MTPYAPRPDHSPRHTIPALLALIGLLSFGGLATTSFGQTIVNPSFEIDASNGAGTGPITGWPWTGNGGGTTDSTPPSYADNGTIPDGTKVAFMRAGTMHQVVSGFTPGLQYRLRYYENARVCCGTNTPNLQVTVGGVTVVAAHTLVAVGGTNPYVPKVTEPFTATAASLDVAFVVTGTGDFTVLLDKVDIFKSLQVTNTNDSGPGSLRQAVLDASAGNTITFAQGVTGTIGLLGKITINKNLTIIGPGSSKLTLHNARGDGVDNGVLEVTGGTVSISGLSVTGGRTTAPANLFPSAGGAGIKGNALTLTDVTVSDCIATATVSNGFFFPTYGGGVFGFNVTLNNCTIANNQAIYGGGIAGSATINNSLITGNTTNSIVAGTAAGRSGGGLALMGNSSINNSTISSNTAHGPALVAVGFDEAEGGGGLAVISDDVTVMLTNTTVTQNVASSPVGAGVRPHVGGGIYLHGSETSAVLINSTVTKNTTMRPSGGGDNSVGLGAGICVGFNATGFTIRNSIVAGNVVGSSTRTGDDVFSPAVPLTSEGYNVIGNGTGANITGTTTGNIVGTSAAPVDARLSPLGFYGGATPTHALLTTSPAINAGNTANSPATDQRGAARVGIADIGAFELNNTANAGTYVMILPQGTVTVPYSYSLVPNSSGFTYTVTSGALPGGITLTTQTNVVTLSGTPTAAGTFNFAITGSNGTLTNATNYRLIVTANPVAPTVTAINPSSGNVIGSETVTITGTNFTGATGVSIGGTPVISFTVLSATSITAVTPAHAMGTASVVVSNAGSASAANTLYTYLPALFTQQQYTANGTANYTAGQNNVINSPNTFNLYTLSQVQSLNVGVPLLVKDSATGKFKLTITVRKSADLATTPFAIFPMNGAGMTSVINAQGMLEFTFPAPGNAAFFRLESQ